VTVHDSPEERVLRLVGAARRIADPADPLGREARAVLPASTGLSPAGVVLALEQCLEIEPPRADIAALIASVGKAPRAHVLLSANVFVAAHRAIALALAASGEVFVRPSRREPEMVRLLARGAPELFRVVDELEPSHGDHVYAYGSDETIAIVRRNLGSDVTIHAHGTGVGVAVVDVLDRPDFARVADALVEDVVLFDQRGCLSPRTVFVLGGEAGARTLANELGKSLERAELRIPRGRLDADEAARAVRYRDTMHYAGELVRGGVGFVGLDVVSSAVVVPPVGRHVHVMATRDLERSVAPMKGLVVTVATLGSKGLEERCLSCFPGARKSLIGRMQRPPFDGPVDRRLMGAS
jgi:hypothetical protein